MQADGKNIIGGSFRTVNGLVRPRIARLNADGSGDAGFHPDRNVTALSYPGVSIAENGTAPDAVTVTIPQGAAARLFARLKVMIVP